MFLHIATDEKFLDNALVLFEAAVPCQNYVWLRLEPGVLEPKFVKWKDRIRYISTDSEGLSVLAGETIHFKAVFLHGLDAFSAQLVNLSPVNSIFVWLAWGFDIYNAFPSYPWEMHQPATRRLLREAGLNKVGVEIEDTLKAAFFRMGWRNSSMAVRINAIQRVNFCATVLQHEWTIVTKLGFRGKFFRFNYSWVDALTAGSKGDSPLGHNLLIGNSATSSCNHADVFRRIANSAIAADRLIVPLTYGDMTYRSQILALGKSILDQRFLPLCDYLPITDYVRLLKTCGAVVMNHIRQQAMGNVVASLALGARVFLNEKNPVYDFFKGLGVSVFSVQTDWALLNKMDSLAAHLLEKNLSIINQEFSFERSVTRAADIIKLINK